MASISGGSFGSISEPAKVVTQTPGTHPAGHVTLADIAPSTLPGASHPANTGFDSVVGPGTGSSVAGGGDQPAVTQTQDGGNTVVHMPDGTTIVILGSNNIDTSFSH